MNYQASILSKTQDKNQINSFLMVISSVITYLNPLSITKYLIEKIIFYPHFRSDQGLEIADFKTIASIFLDR